MNSEYVSYWRNNRTDEWEAQPEGFLFTLTDQTALDYISQHPSAQGMFMVLRQMGWSIPDAMIHTLEASIGGPYTKEVTFPDADPHL
jgi:hypothetical protein